MKIYLVKWVESTYGYEYFPKVLAFRSERGAWLKYKELTNLAKEKDTIIESEIFTEEIEL